MNVIKASKKNIHIMMKQSRIPFLSKIQKHINFKNYSQALPFFLLLSTIINITVPKKANPKAAIRIYSHFHWLKNKKNKNRSFWKCYVKLAIIFSMKIKVPMFFCYLLAMLTFSFLKLCKENYQCSLVKLLAILTFSSLKLCNTCNTMISSFHQL